MSTILRRLLARTGLRIEYVCEWGVYSHRYDGADHWISRPIHPRMGIAPPWARRRIVNVAREQQLTDAYAEGRADERESIKPLTDAVEQILDSGHMDTEDLARLRAAWEAL